MLFYLIVIFMALVCVYVINGMKKPRNYPPGPPWLPQVGNLLQVKKLSKALRGQHLAFLELAKKYNTNVLGLKLGNEHVVVVSSYPVVRKVLTEEEYEGRPKSFFIRLRSMGTNKGVTCTDGDFWRTQRNFLTTHLRFLGYGKNLMEEMIREELVEVLSILEELNEEVRMGTILAPAVINILWALTAGARINRRDDRLNKLLVLLGARSKAFDMSGGILSQYPWLRFLVPTETGFNLIQNLNKELKEMLLETIREHYTNWYENRNDDLIYSFITEMRKENVETSTFSEDQLIMVCLDLFIAGSQTTSNTLDFAFMAMILYPEIQRKVHECLDQEFSKSQNICYTDRHRVPYVQAVLLEVQRVYAVAPLCGPRRVLKDTRLEGYNIPKNTTVLISLYSVHHDKEYWKDPEIFKPERFLDENGQLIPQDRVIPFGLGKRRCLGDVLAKRCIFLFFVEVMKKYENLTATGHEIPKGRPLPGITLSPEFYTAKLVSR